MEGQADPVRVFANLVAEAMQDRPQVGVGQPAERLTNFKDFKIVGPLEFGGTTDPIKAQTWVEEMEKLFEVTCVAEEQKTAFATFMMKGEANYWWKANKNRAGEGIITWTRFKELFFENYFSENMKSSMEVKFLELKQGDMTVAEYAAKFNELARFAPHQVYTEKRRARRFEQGLRPDVFSQVSVLRIDSFAAMLESSIIAEEGNTAIAHYEQGQKQKLNCVRNKSGSSGVNKSNKRKWDNDNRSLRGQHREKRCQKCKKKHYRKCLKGTDICFKCGQEGHILANCPNNRKNMGCFACGSADHQAKDCPKKEGVGRNNSKSRHNQLTIEG